MIKKDILLIPLAMCFTLSCEKILFEEEMASTAPEDNFEYLWNECNEKYTYFDVKGVDWDEVRTKYVVSIYDGMTKDSLFNVLGAMLRELRDDHANLVSDFQTSFYGVEYLSQDNFDWRVIVDNYITRNHILSGPFAHNFLANQSIGYLRVSSFDTTIDPESLNFILERYQNTNGLILDLRENGGGAISNVFKILARFVDNETLVYYSRIKAGPAHNDFDEPKGAFAKPSKGTRYTKPVIVLTDRGTYSSGSLLALATKALPNVMLMGDTTGGGLGIPNGGQLPNGWFYRFSITQTLSLDLQPDLENGVPPDITILLDNNNPQRDEILESAIEQLQ